MLLPGCGKVRNCLINPNCALSNIWWGGYALLYREFPKLSKIKLSFLLLIFLFVLIPSICSWKVSFRGRNYLKITQVCRKTTLNLLDSITDTESIDEDGSYVVIKNTGKLSYEINKLYLLDKEDEEDGELLQNLTIGAGEEYRYTMTIDESLNIKKKGGTIVYLSDENKNILDQIKVPALSRDESYVLNNNTWEIISIAEDEEETITVPTPVFSEDSGFYDDAFNLTLSAEDGLEIYYTVDSSTPTTESTAYTSPIYIYNRSGEDNQYRSIQNVYRHYLEKEPIGLELVDKCFVVRAIAIDSDGNMSDVVTKSYFIGMDKYLDKNVISLVSDPDGLFGDEGIYITGAEYDEWYESALAELDEGEELDWTDAPKENYMHRGIDWERIANLELFNEGQSVNNQLVGIRIQGGSARYGNALKRFSIYSRKEYSGSKWFDTDFFDETKSHSVVIRNGDTNAITQALASNRSALNILGKSAVLFLDGEYWYTSYLYEKISEKYFSEHYNVNEDNIIYSRDGATVTEDVNNEDSFEYLTNFIETHDLNDDEDYAELQNLMDIQSYIDYWAINIYLANMDVAEDKNIIAWRTVLHEDDNYGDSKWRWVFYDMDLLTSQTVNTLDDVNSDAEINSFNLQGLYVNNAMDEGTFWQALTVRPDFCQQFVLSFMDIANTNFSLSNVESVLEEYGYDISYDDYFFQERPKYIFKYLAEEFGLSGTQETVTLCSNQSGSPITLNTISPELSDAGTWSGTYFIDYPVTVSVDSDEFDHWEVTTGNETKTYTDSTIEVSVVKGGVEIYAVFK
jgi:hypothetical protein